MKYRFLWIVLISLFSFVSGAPSGFATLSHDWDDLMVESEPQDLSKADRLRVQILKKVRKIVEQKMGGQIGLTRSAFILDEIETAGAWESSTLYSIEILKLKLSDLEEFIKDRPLYDQPISPEAADLWLSDSGNFARELLGQQALSILRAFHRPTLRCKKVSISGMGGMGFGFSLGTALLKCVSSNGRVGYRVALSAGRGFATGLGVSLTQGQQVQLDQGKWIRLSHHQSTASAMGVGRGTESSLQDLERGPNRNYPQGVACGALLGSVSGFQVDMGLAPQVTSSRMLLELIRN